MKKLLILLALGIIVVSVLVFSESTVMADIPKLINYQGMVTNAEDKPLDGTCNILFKIYGSESGTDSLWREYHTNVEVTKGLFNVILGSLNTLNLPFDAPYWLGIRLDGEPEFSPRIQLTSMGYAYRAKMADSAFVAVSAPTGGGWTDDGAVVRLATSTDKVGIGTGIPAEKLHVAGDIRLNAGGGIAFGDDNTKIFESSYDLYLTADDDLLLQPDDDIYIGADGSPSWILVNPGAQKIGIGTMSPSAHANLHVVGSGGASYPIYAEWSGSSAGAAIIAKNTGTGGDAIQANADGSGRSAIYARGSSGVDYAIWGDANGATWASYFNGKTYVSDKIGIGTTSPQNKLDVEGAMVVGSSYSGSSTAPSNGMLVQGNTGIGTTGPGSHRLYVESSGSGVDGATAFIQNTHASGLAMIVEATSSDLPLLVSQKGDGDVFRCDSWTGGWHSVFKVENDGRVVCSELQLTGGSDLSEQFNIKSVDEDVKPGMLVCIDPEHLGELTVSTKPYDRTVAGIISGAGGIETGVLMGQKDSKADGSHPVALTGRVYCWADVSNGSIQPGDLLTTSDIPGHAMKVTDYARAQGAIIGKAMSSLEEGEGLVLVLVSLQ